MIFNNFISILNVINFYICAQIMIKGITTYFNNPTGVKFMFSTSIYSRTFNAIHIIQFENLYILKPLHEELQIVYANLRV